MKTLEMGYRAGDKGLSFNETVEKLGIDLSDENFEINYVIWFYSNFYNPRFEPLILALSTATNSSYYLNKTTYKNVKNFNSSPSYLKGDALNKYIDFLELKRTRRASRNATYLAFGSMLVALMSIITPIIYPKYIEPKIDEIESQKRNESKEHKKNDSLEAEPRTKQMNNSQANTTT